jgi:hypothetical protein
MSTPLTPLPIRLFCDLAARLQTLIDLNTGLPPQFVRGDDIEIDIGIGSAGTLLAPTLTNIASVTCQVFTSENATGAPLMSCNVAAAAMNLALTGAQWTGDTTPFYHAAFLFPNSQTVISLGGANSANYWLRIFLTTADATAKIVTLAEGPITVFDAPVTTTPVSPLTGNARFFTVGGVVCLQIKSDTDGKFYTLGVENESGVPTLYLSDVGY